jgi:hypothetical protein
MNIQIVMQEIRYRNAALQSDKEEFNRVDAKVFAHVKTMQIAENDMTLSLLRELEESLQKQEEKMLELDRTINHLKSQINMLPVQSLLNIS